MTQNKREAAEQVIRKMTSRWESLQKLADKTKIGGRYRTLTKREMANFLREREDLERKIVHVKGTTLTRTLWRKVKTE